MKISNTNYINQTYGNQAAVPTGKAKPPAPVTEDSINLSSTTRDLQKISAASQVDPENRAKRVQELKQKVETNQYTVNAEKVAEKMIGSIMDGLG